MTESKNILYIGGFDLPDKNAAAQRVVANSKILRDLGHRVFLIGLSKDVNIQQYKIIDFEELDYYNLKYPTTLAQWYRYLVRAKHLKKIIKDNQIDCIIAYNYPGVALLNLYRYTRKHKIKLIGDCTEWYEAQGNILFRLIKKSDIFIRMRLIHPRLDGMIVISNFLYNYYQKFKNPIINVPPLVDLAMDKWTSATAINTDNTIKLIYAGTPGNGNKDRLDWIIETTERVNSNSDRKFHLTVVGITLGEYKQLFKVDNIQKTTNVNFKGRISHVDTLNEIKKSDFQIFIRENNLTNTAGFPTKYVEAISCGTPVLTNLSSNISDFLEEGKTGFILETSSRDLFYEKLLSLVRLDQEHINKMKNYCLQSRTFDIVNYRSDFKLLIKQIYN